MNLETRIEKAEEQAAQLRESERQAALQAFKDWRSESCSFEELEAWRKVLLHLPLSDSLLAKLRITRQEADDYLIAIGPPTDEQIGMFKSVLSRLPREIIARLAGTGFESCESHQDGPGAIFQAEAYRMP